MNTQGRDEEEEFVEVRGIYANKNDAFKKALRIANNNLNFGQVSKEEIQEAKKQRRGALFYEEDYCWAVGMETIVLDQQMNEGFDYLLG